MKIAMLSPINMSRSEFARQQLIKRQAFLDSTVPAGVRVVLLENPDGPEAIQTMEDEYISIPGMMARSRGLEGEYDAIITGCFGEPGLDGIRELVRIPVLGCCGPAVYMASLLGKRFSVLSPVKSTVPSTRELIEKYGIASHLASIRPLEIPVINIRKNREAAVQRAVEVAKTVIEQDGADTIVLGCMSLAYQDVAKDLNRQLGIPVINPLYCAVQTAAYLAQYGLSQSALVYQL